MIPGRINLIANGDFAVRSCRAAPEVPLLRNRKPALFDAGRHARGGEICAAPRRRREDGSRHPCRSDTPSLKPFPLGKGSSSRRSISGAAGKAQSRSIISAIDLLAGQIVITSPERTMTSSTSSPKATSLGSRTAPEDSGTVDGHRDTASIGYTRIHPSWRRVQNTPRSASHWACQKLST